MGSAHILVRVRDDQGRWRAAQEGQRGGERRYIVRWRYAGRDSRLRHGGSFPTRREAELRVRYLRDELAAGRMPDVAAGAVRERGPTVRDAVEAHIAARVDVEERTRANYRYDLARLPPDIQALPAGEVTAAVLQRWVNSAVEDPRWGAGSIIDTVGLLRGALTRAGIQPNPAAPEVLTLPRYRAPEVRPPSSDDLIRLAGRLPPHWRALMLVIEGSGMRIGEALQLLGRDVDRERSRLLVRRERTKGTGARVQAGERWVPLRAAAMGLIPVAPADRRVFGGWSAVAFREYLRGAVADLGVARITPHMLRHRYASRLVLQGMPITLVCQRLGHTRPSMTLDVYSHVLVDDQLDPAVDIADVVPLVGATPTPTRGGRRTRAWRDLT